MEEKKQTRMVSYLRLYHEDVYLSHHAGFGILGRLFTFDTKGGVFGLLHINTTLLLDWYGSSLDGLEMCRGKNGEDGMNVLMADIWRTGGIILR